MKRRKFLVYSILLGLGLFSAPLKANASEHVVIPLPEAEEHVRHGNFNLNELKTGLKGLGVPNGVTNVRFQRLYKNGYTESQDDLCIVTFNFDGHVHIVQFKFYELCDKGYIDCETKSKNNKKVFRLM
ncbi:hypothetical protein K6119_02350 [Paracrocinitomix mangrovi]|uniref:hypothetical protein n=1 Tax=Paracrocinitomix mangrovi TaxID=2862509 RepID=UPI001C8ED3A4|nr:hypothetical protein [Paracrocinitomix mangrovi]UKN02361.1 hypothetical protein K6119_02350 [Paracrocinitomix mangrovi]